MKFKPEVKKEIEIIIETPQKDLCPDCTSEKIIKCGKRKTKIGNKQLLL